MGVKGIKLKIIKNKVGVKVKKKKKESFSISLSTPYSESGFLLNLKIIVFGSLHWACLFNNKTS